MHVGADRLTMRGEQMPDDRIERMPIRTALVHVTNALAERITLPPPSVLEARVQVLEDENLLLREALGMTWDSPREWKLTPMEAKFTGILMRVQIAPRERLMTALYAHTADPPNDQIIPIMASHIRHKIRPFGLDIRCQKGSGYYLAEIDKAA